MRDKRNSVKRFGRFPPNYSFSDRELNCELYVEKLDELIFTAASVHESACCGEDDSHRFIHTLHRIAALTFSLLSTAERVGPK
jgi:hypothetical protein